MIKNLPVSARATGDTGWEDPLEEEMASHSNILAWKIPWTEEPGGLPPMELQKAWSYKELDMIQQLSMLSLYSKKLLLHTHRITYFLLGSFFSPLN